MKKVLSLLMAFVFVQVQTWAASGGPFSNPQTAKNFSGSYAGVLIPQTQVGAVAGAPAVDPNRAASIGLFTLAQPDVGPATGALVAFVNGAAFNGTITGIIDPNDNSFSGIVDATSTFQIRRLVPTTQIVNGIPVVITTAANFNVYAQGTLETEIEFSTDPSPALTTTGARSTRFPARITGTAVLEIFADILPNGTPDVTQITAYEVDGFKQSDTVTQTTFTFGGQFGQGGQP